MCLIVAILQLSLIFIDQISPFGLIALHGIQMMRQVREYFDNRLIRRYFNEVDVPKLTLGYVCDLTIEELRYGWELLFVYTFEIALFKELNEEKICPEATNFEWFGWIGDVCHVEHEFDKKFLVFGVMRLETGVCHSAANMPKLLEVPFHVSI